MRITADHLDCIERLPEGANLALDEVPGPWPEIADDWFALTGSDTFDDLLLPPAATTIYGLPRPEEMPRPGAVAGWTHREWIGWATAHGYEEVPRSKHAYQYRHRLAPWLLLSMSSSPGDHRWSMATATDQRFVVDAAAKRLGANLYVAVQVVTTNPERHPSTAVRERLRALRAALVEAGSDRETALRWVAEHGDVPWEHFDRIEPDAATVGAVRTLFAVLLKEFDLSPRAALRRLGHEAEDAALLAKRISSASDLLPGDVQESLEELVDRLREERTAHERAKDAVRAARPADLPDAGASLAAPASDPAADLRQELRRRLEVLRATAVEATAAIAKAASEAIAGIENAALTEPTEIELLRAENTELKRRIAELETGQPRRRVLRKRD